MNATEIGEEDPDFEGGCYVHVQKYLHDMAAWEALSVAEQEQVVGRTKLEDIELDDAAKPANSHVAVNTIEDEQGNELQIMRDNMPFGQVGKGEYGTYYIGYSRDPAVTERMLHNMFIGEPREHRPDPGLLRGGDRNRVLHPDRRLPRQPTAASLVRGGRRRRRLTGDQSVPRTRPDHLAKIPWFRRRSHPAVIERILGPGRKAALKGCFAWPMNRRMSLL